ncbi:MAG: hypothetical protein K6T90_02495 [Leptolyngbyaceae cyanobacterium HOT.MB2.61]|nr:hypothetical protein [Leptolyngbyaceae cyanobacterium HOT.MB2.61]
MKLLRVIGRIKPFYSLHRLSMSNSSSGKSSTAKQSQPLAQSARWHTFPEILQRLHQERIFIHSDQLAEFMVYHGLPVDLCYVPKHLKQRAKLINENYQGDMARLEMVKEQPSLFKFE